MKAYVICANDSIKGVVRDDIEKALEKMEELSKKDYELYRYIFASYEEYKCSSSWHLTETEIY